MKKNLFKRLTCFALSAIMAMSISITAFANEININTETNSFNLAEYLQKNPVSSKTEFISAILNNGDSTAIESIDTSDLTKTTSENDKFEYVINKDEQMIYIKTISVKEESSSTRASTYINNASATYEGYSWLGVHVFTVTTKGTFQYNKSSYCDVIKSEGYFNPAFLSLWNASTWINNGNYSKSKAYIDTYGTANLNFSVAQILGLTLNLQSVNYNLELTCDTYGNVDGTWTYDIP